MNTRLLPMIFSAIQELGEREVATSFLDYEKIKVGAFNRTFWVSTRRTLTELYVVGENPNVDGYSYADLRAEREETTLSDFVAQTEKDGQKPFTVSQVFALLENQLTTEKLNENSLLTGYTEWNLFRISPTVFLSVHLFDGEWYVKSETLKGINLTGQNLGITRIDMRYFFLQ